MHSTDSTRQLLKAPLAGYTLRDYITGDVQRWRKLLEKEFPLWFHCAEAIAKNIRGVDGVENASKDSRYVDLVRYICPFLKAFSSKEENRFLDPFEELCKNYGSGLKKEDAYKVIERYRRVKAMSKSSEGSVGAEQTLQADLGVFYLCFKISNKEDAEKAINFLSVAGNCQLEYLEFRCNVQGQGYERDVIYYHLGLALEHVKCNFVSWVFGADSIRPLMVRTIYAPGPSIGSMLLDLKSVKIGEDVTDINEIASSLKREDCKLRYLCLRKTGIGDDALKIIFEAVRQNPNCSLTVLDLSVNAITKKVIPVLSSVLFTSQNSLTHINLCDNEIDYEGILLLAFTVVQMRLVKRRDIKIEVDKKSKADFEMGLAQAEAVFAALGNHDEVASLRFNGDCKINSVGARYIAIILSGFNDQIRTTCLDLSNSEIGSLGIEEIRHVLVRNHAGPLTSINFSNSKIDAKGIFQLAFTVFQMRQKKMCDVKIEVDEKHKIELDLCLKQIEIVDNLCKNLEDDSVWNLSNYNIGDYGAQYLVYILLNSPGQVTSLDLSNNAIGMVGVKNIIDVLQDRMSCSLTFLNLTNNKITSSAVALLADTILTERKLGHNIRIELGEEHKEELAKCIQENEKKKSGILGKGRDNPKDNIIGTEGANVEMPASAKP
jgi:hypothetical protein